MIRLKDLKPGTIIEQGGERLLLVEHAPSRYGDDIPYIVEDEGDDAEGPSMNYAKQRWLVELPNGFRTHRHIEYFHSRGYLRFSMDGDGL
jgi:hypothetical protein